MTESSEPASIPSPDATRSPAAPQAPVAPQNFAARPIPLAPQVPAAPGAAAIPSAPILAPLPSPAVQRPAGLFEPATFRQTVMVAAALAAIFFGSQLLNEALPAIAVDAPGRPVEIGEGATITPLEDWVVSEHEGGGIRLEKGAVAIDLFTQAAPDGGALAALYRDEVLWQQASQLTTGDMETVASDAGSGARFTYQGIFTGVNGAIDGEVTAFVTAGHGVVADAWAPQGRLDGARAEVHVMLESIEVPA